MRLLLLAIFALSALGCNQRKASVDALPESVVGIEAESSEPQFSLVVPEGFAWIEENRIWYNKNTRASVTIGHEQGKSLDAVDADFTVDRMQSHDMELTSKEIRDIEGRRTLLVKGNRLGSSYPQQFCVVAFETSVGCAQLNAIYPANSSQQMKMEMEEALLESKYGIPE